MGVYDDWSHKTQSWPQRWAGCGLSSPSPVGAMTLRHDESVTSRRRRNYYLPSNRARKGGRTTGTYDIIGSPPSPRPASRAARRGITSSARPSAPAATAWRAAKRAARMGLGPYACVLYAAWPPPPGPPKRPPSADYLGGDQLCHAAHPYSTSGAFPIAAQHYCPMKN